MADLIHHGYNDSNRPFLQAFMAHSSMTFEEAQPVLAEIFSVHGMLLPLTDCYGIEMTC